MSPKISTYRKSYDTQDVITSLIEEWWEKLDQNFLVGAVLTDLSKAFDCIPHDFLIVKLAAYGFDLNALALIFAYLKNRNQSIRMHNIHSSFRNIVSGVPQECMYPSGHSLFTAKYEIRIVPKRPFVL